MGGPTAGNGVFMHTPLFAVNRGATLLRLYQLKLTIFDISSHP